MHTTGADNMYLIYCKHLSRESVSGTVNLSLYLKVPISVIRQDNYAVAEYMNGPLVLYTAQKSHY